jgi:hypothetical protein
VEPDVLRTPAGWRVTGSADILEDEELVRLLVSEEFSVHSVVVVPELAPLLFQGAIEQVQASVVQLMEASRQSADEEHEHEAFQFVMVTSALDKSLRHAAAGIVLCLAAAEAQINEWAADLGGWRIDDGGKSEDRLPLVDKLTLIASRFGTGLEKGSRPISWLIQAVDTRDDLVHSKPIEQELPLTSFGAREPARWLSVESRRAGVAVRKSLIAVANAIDREPPSYLAYCPEADPADDPAWLSTVFQTGLRADSVFPPLSERLPGKPPNASGEERSDQIGSLSSTESTDPSPPPDE